jgi:hypothetical protein
MRAAASLILCLCFVTTLRAENSVGYTAEWLAHQSELIAVGTPVDVEDIKGPGEVWFTKARFKLTKVIKGPASPGDQVTVFDYAYNPRRYAMPPYTNSRIGAPSLRMRIGRPVSSRKDRAGSMPRWR